MLNTIGGTFGGYGLYLVKGKPVFTYVQLTAEKFRWEGPAALAPGKHTIVFDFKREDEPEVSVRGAPVSCRWTARKPTARKYHTAFRSWSRWTSRSMSG